MNRTRSEMSRRALGTAVTVLLASAGFAHAQSNTCATATVVVAGSNYPGSTSSATQDGTASCGDSNSTADVWFRYTPAQTCLLNLNTCTSDYDTVLSIHSGCPGTAANDLACNDDTCNVGSQVSITAQAGVTYYIRVSGWNGS